MMITLAFSELKLSKKDFIHSRAFFKTNLPHEVKLFLEKNLTLVTLAFPLLFK